MDYEEEHRNEIEALESIYPDEMTIVEREPYHAFELALNAQSTRDDSVTASCTVKFTYTPKYPDEAPEIEITASESLCDNHLAALEEHMKQLANENLGMVVVFTIVSSVQDKLNELVENLLEEQRNEKERLEREVEEAEQKKFEGTRVTIETFMSWKAKFDAEMAELRKHKVRAAEDGGPKKITGRDLFMQDHAMDDSDVKFLEEGGEVVEVDESLFQDIGDLTLDDEGLDDELADLDDDDD